MSECRSFAPVVSAKSRLLVLGSMPGAASLQQQQYYAHPRNAFWPVMQHVFGIDAAWTYPARIDALRNTPVALWDVIECCERPGSLDSAIAPASVVANDFAGLLVQYPQIRTILFNGQSVATLFRRHAQSQIPAALLPPCLCLPSTSPANARLPLQQKQQVWQQAIAAVLRPDGRTAGR